MAVRADNAYLAPAAAADAEAAIYFVGGQYLFHSPGDKNKVETIKFLSPGLVKQAFMFQAIDSGWLSPETLRFGTCKNGDYVISFHPPARHQLTFWSNAGLTTLTYTVPLPGLVFAGLDNNWHIWAVKSRRFAPKLELFHAPLPNVNNNGLICFGDNSHPKVSKDGEQAAWRLFTSTHFNSHHADSKSREYPKNIISQLSFLHRKKASRYPMRDLVSFGRTVEEAVQRLIN